MMQCCYTRSSQCAGLRARMVMQHGALGMAQVPTQCHQCGPCSRSSASLKFPKQSSSRASTELCAIPTPAAPLLQEGWGLWAVLLSSAAFGQVSSKTSWGQALSTPLISMTAGIVLAATGILPTDCPSFDVVWQYLMPLAAACYLVETDMSQLLSVGGPTLIAFLVGAVTMVAGAVLAFVVLHPYLGPDGGKIVACLCASYVGGSVNFAAVSKAVALPSALVPAAMAADNIAMALFLAILSSVPASTSTTKTATDTAGQDSASPPSTQTTPSTTSTSLTTANGVPITAESLALVIAAASLSCWLGQKCAAYIAQPCLALMITAFLAAGIGSLGQALATQMSQHQLTPALARSSATTMPTTTTTTTTTTIAEPQATPPRVFAGASQLASVLMSLFFVIIGCSAGSLSSLARFESVVMIVFLIIMVFTHWLLLWVVNTLLLKLPMPALILGSNANVGGPATAAAMAASKGWQPLIQPAMLCGSLGYAIGTLAGLMVARSIGLAMQ